MLSHTRTAVLLLLALAAAAANGEFHYEDGNPGNGPSSWSQLPNAQACAGGPTARQSPIDLIAGAARYTTEYGDLSFDYRDEDDAEMFNNGHTVEIETDNTHRLRASRICGTGVARLVQVHFHWSQDDDEGSEHTLEGERYPLEAHFVHLCAEYATIEEAVASNDPEAVIVVATLFELDNEEQSTAMDVIGSHLHGIKEPDSSIRFTRDLPLNKMVKSDEPYYTYLGSFTTPTCNQIVRWFVQYHRQKVRRTFLQQIRLAKLLISGDDTFGEGRNWRPTQPTNGRDVVRSFQNRPVPSSKTWFYSESAAASAHAVLSITMIACTAMFLISFF